MIMILFCQIQIIWHGFAMISISSSASRMNIRNLARCQNYSRFRRNLEMQMWRKNELNCHNTIERNVHNTDPHRAPDYKRQRPLVQCQIIFE